MPEGNKESRNKKSPAGPPERSDRQPERKGGSGGNNSNNSGGGGGSGLPGPKPMRGMFGIIAALLFAFFIVSVLSSGSTGGIKLETWKEFETRYTQGYFEKDSIELREGVISAEQIKGVAKGELGKVQYTFNPGNRDPVYKQLSELTGGQFKDIPTSPWTNMLIGMIPVLLIILIIWFLLFRGLRSAGGGPGGMLGNFGKSKHKMVMKEKTGITFDDVAGINEAKEEVTEIVEFLRSPKKFTRLGGRIPRGVLLIGEPGCGKTLLAKAIAGEADVPFFSISGSDFVEMFVGVGASRVRDLFKQAKDSAPCIIFLDEIDAVGRKRGGGFTTGGHDEREQTLNAILVEMDGFATGDGIIVVAATNRADVLDPALTRPGRFDRQIVVNLPDVKGRLEILKVHAKKVKLGPNADLERLARVTPTFSGADLAAIINEAALAATMQNKDYIEHADLEEARDKIKFGRARKSRVREADENKLTAYHEAGHAVLQVLLQDADPLHKVTIIPRGNAGGATFSMPEKDRSGYGLKWLTATMKVMCGGRIAEHKAMGDFSSGASMDISQVTRIAKTMIEEWGMSPKLGFVRYAGSDTRELYMPEKGYSEKTATLIDEEVRRLSDEAYVEASKMLDENWTAVVYVAEALLRYETLDAADVLKIMRGESIGKPTVSELLAAEARKTREAAAAAAGTPPTTGTTGSTPDVPGTIVTPA